MADYLLIDVGNGRAKLGLASTDSISEHRDLPTADLNADALRAAVLGWEFDRVIACSVVPRVVPVLGEAFAEKLTVLRHDTPMPIGIRYPRPQSIGPDRLANAIALSAMHVNPGKPGIVLDFGTAVTFDVLSVDNCYIGGVIAPGLRLMTDYLHERTALLPRVDLHEPTTAIGQSTEGAILAGAGYGYRGMIRGILDALRKELPDGDEARVVSTGGDAEWIVAGMSEIQAVDPDLTLHGLRLLGNWTCI